MPAGLGAGDLPDGTRNARASTLAAATTRTSVPARARPVPSLLFEFYALDTKLDLPASVSRDDLMKAMDGHVIGKAAYVGRFHAQP